ncbi:MAG: hypothetical protein AB1523_08815 [Bacillota bacterium]
MDCENIKIELSGNPFVDTGLAVISSLAGLNKIDELTLADLKRVHGDGLQLTEWNSKLKAFTQVFGTNNPLYQASYGYKGGPSGTNKAIYRSVLEGLLNEIRKPGKGLKCWACGEFSDFNLARVFKKAVEDNGRKAPEERWVGRDWFPLAGSLGSDAQALPAGSQPPYICAKCLFAIHYLPMGLILLDGRLVVFQSTSIEFWYELVRDIVNEVRGRVYSGIYETLGSNEGNNVIMKRIFEVFKRLQKEKYYGSVPAGTALYIWRFSNSGTSPDCMIEEIPNSAIIFLWEAVKEGLEPDLASLIKTEGKNPRYSLFQCILNKRDYPNLYPEGKKKGASPKLFALYQTYICNHSERALHMAWKLAKKIAENVSEKELHRLQRPEALQEAGVRSRFRASMVQMAGEGEFTLNDYLDLFPLKEGQGVNVEWDGWKLFRFYLHHINEDLPQPEDRKQIITKSFPQLHYYAGQIFNHYVKEKGKDRFQREILLQMKRRLDIPWLRDQFVKLAESENGFTYGNWLKFCTLDDGKLYIPELLFQMRLLWTQWGYENRGSVDISGSTEEDSFDGLPEEIKVLLKSIFIDYVERRGLDRFYKDVLLRLRQKEIGLFWFKQKLTTKVLEQVDPIEQEKWEEFLVDEEGQSIKAERLFQLHLFLANFYRVRRLILKQD